MTIIPVQEFIAEIEIALKKYFAFYRIDILFHTSKSFKANVYLSDEIFIATRYNGRNGRVDFALVHNEQRIFGYDNLKRWHYHPYENPSKHIPSSQPTINKIIQEMKTVFEKVSDRK